MMKNRIYALIPARYASTRLNGKPLLKLNGKTIIQRTYEQTCRSKLIEKVFVVTDSDIIIDNVKSFGGDYIKMSLPCLNGTERICRVLDQIPVDVDIIVNVQGDEPFIDPLHIDLCITKMLNSSLPEDVVCTTLHSKIGKDLDGITQLTNRGIGKMILDRYSNVLYCSRAMIPHTKTGIPDDNTIYMSHIGIFVFKRSYLPKFLEEDMPAQLSEDIEWLKILEQGYRIRSYEVSHTEIGINTIEDYKYLKSKYES